MKESKYTKPQIDLTLHQAEAGTRYGGICRKMGISESSFYNRKEKLGGQGTSEM